jgi:hypothetical protein
VNARIRTTSTTREFRGIALADRDADTARILLCMFAEPKMTTIEPRSVFRAWRASSALFLLVLALLCGCEEAYCQSGAKYGTQCPTINEVEWQRTQQREEPWPPERTTQPAPGCVLATPTGLVQQPYTTGPTRAAASLPPSYLISGACVSRQQPVYGAVR